MCGRYALHSLLADLQRHFGLFDSVQFQPRYNVTPSSLLPVVRMQGQERELALCRWGFVPYWLKTPPRTRPINARAETAAVKPWFRTALHRRRCLVPANGFYEWTRGTSPKQPWYFRLDGPDLLAFAGLWDRWGHESGPEETFAILTTAANQTLQPVHDRMPVILDKDQYDAWLETGDPGLLQPYAGAMLAWPVGREVNTPDHDGPELLHPAAAGDRN